MSAAAATARKPLRLKGPEGRNPRLLLAEDSDPVRIVTAAILKGMGCEVEAVIHGEQAVRQAAEHPFDVIVLDIEMPVMDGITAARSIRRLGGTAGETPLMALSAFLSDSVRTGEWRDTFDIALPKPTNRTELHDAITTALNWQKSKNQPDQPHVLDLDELAAMHGGLADEIWQELLSLACRDIEVCARQMEHAAGAGRHDVVLTFASKLESLGATFAAPRLAALARQLQIVQDPSDLVAECARLLAGALETVAQIRQHMN